MSGIRIIDLSRKGGTERFKIHGSDVVQDSLGTLWSEQGAQVNKIEKIYVNNTEVTPDSNKKVHLTIPEDNSYSIEQLDTPTAGYLHSYRLTKNGDGIQGSAVINIPLDFLVREVHRYICGQEPEGVQPPPAETGIQDGDVYIDWVINARDAVSEDNASHLYLPMTDLSIAFTAGVGITIDDDNTISVNIGNGLEVDEDTNTIQIKIDTSGEETYLAVDENGLKMSETFDNLLDSLVYFTDHDFSNSDTD